MAFHGDVTSFPLPELLQWVDAARKKGSLQLLWEGGERKLFCENGQIVATSSSGLWERIARMLSLSGLSSGEKVLEAFREMKGSDEPDVAFAMRGLDYEMAKELAREELFGATADLTVAHGGQFHWTEDTDRGGDEWVDVDLGLRELLFESLRWVDERTDVEKTLPGDGLRIQSLVPPTTELPLIERVILSLAQEGITLGRLRLALGLSRLSTTRRVYDLLKSDRIDVDGAGEVRTDPVSDMLEKGATLVREGQFEAAALVFSALLASDPADRRVREFARVVEREHVAALYDELQPIYVPVLNAVPDVLSELRPEERQVVSLVNGSWDVSTIVLASPARELDTLKALAKLRRLGLLGDAPGFTPSGSGGPPPSDG